MRLRSSIRLFCLGVLAFLVLAGLVGRSYYLQIVEGTEWALDAHGEWSLTVGDRRGAILDRSGLPLTDPEAAWGVAVFPPLVRDRRETARQLAPVLGRPEATVLSALKAMGASGWLAVPGEGRLRLTQQQAGAVNQLGLLGIAAGPAGVRYGPDALARQLVGYVNQSGGQAGLERAFNAELEGEKVPDLLAYRTGNPVTGGLPVMSSVGKPPYDLVTTIDRPVQQAVEAVLNREEQQHGRPKAAVVVMDPFTGEVVAMASRPQADYGELNRFVGDGDGPVLNRAITAYPPGSVMKPLITAEALSSGDAKLTDKFVCTGEVTIGQITFHDDDSHGAHGTITLDDAIAESCNVALLKMANKQVGASRLPGIALRFGFGVRTGILGPLGDAEEQPGFVPPDIPGGALQIVIGGGGMEATPLQVARAYSAIVGGGILPPVTLVKELRSPAGEVVERPQAGQSGVRVMPAATARQIRESLAGVTDPKGNGTGKSAWLAPWGTSGKTGTAEAGSEGAHAWFAGYFPQNNPRYVAVVLVEHGGYGAEQAAPIFRQIAAAILD